MPHNYEYHFEIKPGKFVFVPTHDCLKTGAEVVEQVTKRWSPHRIFYHFGKRGGHVAAMRAHLHHTYFAKIDLSQFFTGVTRTKVVRSLRQIGFHHKAAFDIGHASVVEHNGRKFLPYGFMQSMALATLSVEFSSLGSCLIRINDGAEALVSMYVDDIILSSHDKGLLTAAFHAALENVDRSNFKLNTKKSAPPTKEIDIFNCHLSNGSMIFTDDRITKFTEDFSVGGGPTRAAIARYMEVVNKDQLTEMLRTFV